MVCEGSHLDGAAGELEEGQQGERQLEGEDHLRQQGLGLGFEVWSLKSPGFRAWGFWAKDKGSVEMLVTCQNRDRANGSSKERIVCDHGFLKFRDRGLEVMALRIWDSGILQSKTKAVLRCWRSISHERTVYEHEINTFNGV